VFKMGATNGLQATCHPMHHGRIFKRDDSLEECMSMGVDYVQTIVDNCNERSPNLHAFNAPKLFSLKYYPTKKETCINMCE
jgi:hypothetical protein